MKPGTGKKIGIVALIGSIIAIISWYFLIYKPKHQDAPAPPAGGPPVTPRKNTGSGSSHPANSNVGLHSSSTSGFNPKTYTDLIHKDLNSSFLIPHSAIPYEEAMKLSDDSLIAIYNDWIDRYYAIDGKNMVDAIQSSSSTFNIEWAMATKALVDRLNSL